MDRRSRRPAAAPARKPAVLSDRINTAIHGLIHHFVPDDPNEDEAEAQRRQDYCFNLVRSTLETPSSPDLATDVNHTMDLIRKKLTVNRPNDAWRFSQLYSRLLALPVLNQKWAILYLLYQLADSPDPSDPVPLLQVAEEYEEGMEEEVAEDAVEEGGEAEEEMEDEYGQEPEMRPDTRTSREQSGRGSRPQSEPQPASPQPQQHARTHSQAAVPRERAFDEAFARGGLPKFPPEAARRGPEEAAAASEEEDAAAPGRNVALKSTLLADSYVATTPSETALLRDLPFTLQGLDSASMVFSGEGAWLSLRLPATLPAPIVSLLHRLVEPALLYRRLEAFVQSPAQGLLGQSLRAAIGDELRAYLRLVATLESQIRRALASLSEGEPRRGIGRAGVTLKRCVVWTREATMGLRLMSLVAEEADASGGSNKPKKKAAAVKRGGQILSLIHGFATSHGDPTVGAFAERLLGPVARPFYDILRRWIYDGELADPYHEFFVREQGTAASTDDTAQRQQEEARAKGHSSVWNDKYEVDAAMIPSMMRADFAEKVFLIGKSLNFIRHSCGDAAWVEAYSRGASKELRYGDTATLEAWIDEAYKTTMRRLMHLMTDKFRLFDHLAALKRYVLLGQGDFVALLMESLAPNLDRPATAQYRHTLTSQLDHAIRGSNAQFEPPDILRRLDARMLQQSHGDTGWDCFTLEYKIGAPVDCVVTDWASKQYLKVFNFLWHVKRVEFALASTWHKSMTGARGVLHTRDPAVRQTWKTTRGTLAEMVHLVGQLQYYILFEVIEASWAALQTAIRRDDCTLDDLIAAHTAYLTSITHKGLLGVRRRAYVEMRQAAATAAAAAAAAQAAAGTNPDAAADQPPALADVPAEDANGFPAQLKELLRTMLAFRDAVDGLYSWAVSDFTRRQEADVLRRGEKAPPPPPPRQGDDDEPPSATSAAPAVESELPALQQRLALLGKTFRKRVVYLLADLGYQKDADLRFLGVAMNFNDVYVVPQGKRHHQPKR